MNKLLLSASALLASTAIASAQTCAITQAMVSPNRGQVHTEILNTRTGNRMSFFYARSHVAANGVWAILGVKNQCPPQGCAPTGPQKNDCPMATSTVMGFMDWGAGHKGLASATTSLAYSVKDPSGTIVLSQDVLGQKPKLQSNIPCKPQPEPGLPVSTPVLHTAVETDLGSGDVVLGIASVRIFAAKHPGSSDIDFYAQLNVDPLVTFVPQPPSACETRTDNPAGWYDLYWSLSQNTVSEQLTLGGSMGAILLQQGF